MAKIIDLGNGYARLDGYGSRYASLTFPLEPSQISRLCAEGYLDRNEAIQTYLDMGFCKSHAEWFVRLASVTVAEWRKRLPDARAV